ncbi:MAG: hypothetical protein JST59_02070 [Actinobacteria bacterium]|nr:hypothetical protein [Actinomycetota bacterium]
METGPSSILNKLSAQLLVLGIFQLLLMWFVVSRLLKLCWCSRKKKRTSRQASGLSPAKRVEKMLKCSFDDIVHELQDYDHSITRTTLFNTVRNLNVPDEGPPKGPVLPGARKKKSVTFNLTANSISMRVNTPEAFKFPAEWASNDIPKGYWPDLETFLSRC